MAEAVAETSSVIDFHTCGVCFSGFTEKLRCPKVLRCGHTFCYSCLRSCAENSDTGLSIQCPSCRKVTGRPISVIPTNYQLLQLLSSQKLLEKDELGNMAHVIPELENNINPEGVETDRVRFDGLLESIEAECDVLRVRYFEAGLSRRNHGISHLTDLVTEMRMMYNKINSVLDHPEMLNDLDDDNDANYAFDEGSDDSVDYEFDGGMHLPSWMDFERVMAHEMGEFGYLASDQSEASAMEHYNNTSRYCDICQCDIPRGGEAIHERGRRHIYNAERLENPTMPPYVPPEANRNPRNRNNFANVNQAHRGNRRRGRGAPRTQRINTDGLPRPAEPW